MRELNPHAMFLREHISLPEGLALAAESFCDGWVILNSGDAAFLEKKVAALGWNFISLTDVHLRDGIARSAAEAIQSALRRALQSINRDFNAAEIESVEATRRLWLYTAKARIVSRQIQESPFLGGCEELSVHHAPQTFEAGDRQL
ncbi:MAG: hypothetical protein ACLGXA_15815 [Acidobacteriota bacterium]